MKRAAAATTPSPSQPAAAKEAWGTLVLQMNAEDTQTFELKEDKARLGVRGLGLGLGVGPGLGLRLRLRLGPGCQGHGVSQLNAHPMSSTSPVWPDGPRLAEAPGSPGHALALREASGEPAGRRLSHRVPDTGAHHRAREQR